MVRPIVNMFGLDFNNCSLDQAVDMLIATAKNKEKSLTVTVNVDHVVMLDHDDEMREVYEKSRFCFADGMPIVWLSRLLNKPLQERVTGADLLPAIATAAVQSDLKLFLLGGLPGVAAHASEELRLQNPGLNIVGIYCPPFGFEHDEKESQKIVSMINDSRTDILFVAVGAPKQEKWTAKHLEGLNVGPVLGVGAAFDFVAGTMKRAPVFLQKTGMEWLWRLVQEPGRMWKRYLVQDSRFLILAFKEWCRNK